MPELVSLTIRTLHVLTMAVLVGGTGMLWYGYRNGSLTGLELARRYEWGFWAAIGIVVLTGVGTLGSLGAPGPATGWGQTLLVKLSFVLVFVIGSAVRTLAIVRADETVSRQRVRGRFASRAYGVTTGVLLVLVVLAEVLAHG